MRLSRLILSTLIIAALAGSMPAGAFSVTDGGGLNSGAAPPVAGPNAKEHIANGGGALSGASEPGALPSSDAGVSAPAGGTARWSDSWFSHTIIIGGGWKYPPSSP
jgi:hypothetical protein